MDNSIYLHNYDLYSIEGPDGAGKSTLVKCLIELAEGEPYVFTREPCYPQYTKLLKKSSTPIERALIFSADRYKHLVEFIKVELKRAHVVTDRYYLSSIVYQMMEAVGLSSEEQELFFQWLLSIQPPNLIRPKHTYIVLASPGEMYDRISRRTELPTHTIDQLELLSEYYQIAADRLIPGRYTYVYSDQMGVHEMASMVWDDMKSKSM